MNFSHGDGTNDRLKKKGTGDFQYPFMFGIWLDGGASPLSLAGLRPSRDLLFVSQKSRQNAPPAESYIFPADVAAVENVVIISVREKNCPAPLASPANAPARSIFNPH